MSLLLKTVNYVAAEYNYVVYRRGGKAPLVLSVDTPSRQVVSSMPRPLYPPYCEECVVSSIKPAWKKKLLPHR
jgi:hypothetical protein